MLPSPAVHVALQMDKLIDKLYTGRERGVELSGAIASNQRMMSFVRRLEGGRAV